MKGKQLCYSKMVVETMQGWRMLYYNYVLNGSIDKPVINYFVHLARTKVVGPNKVNHRVNHRLLCSVLDKYVLARCSTVWSFLEGVVCSASDLYTDRCLLCPPSLVWTR